MMTEFEIIDNIGHILKVQTKNRIVMAPIAEIEKKYLFMDVGLFHYIVCPPNKYEKE